MQYNRTMIANAKEQKALYAVTRDAVSKLVLLMNHFHSLDMRYFANEKLRQSEKKEIELEINSLKNHLPETIRSQLGRWLVDSALWREDLDNIHCSL